MADTSYRIVQRDDDTFMVEIACSGALPQVAAGFLTQADAEGWIAQDQRLRASATHSGAPASRQWRGF